MEVIDFISLLLVGLGVITYFWLLRSSASSKSNLPPGPFNLPLVGHLPFLGSLPHITFHKLSQKYGDIMHLKLGSVPFLIVSSERAAKELFKFHSLEFASKSPTISGYYLGNGFAGIAYCEYTPELKRYRKLFNTHLLSSTRLKVYGKVRMQEYHGLARSVLADAGAPVQLRKKFHEMNVNIITYMLFGERFYGPHARSEHEAGLDKFVETVVEALRLSGIFNMSDFIPAIRWMDIQGLRKRYKELNTNVNEYLTSIIQEHRRNPKKVGEPISFIDMLISLDSTEEGVSDIIKISLCFDMLLGGIDTSALSLEWAMAELLRHPDKLEKAVEEIENVVGRDRLVEDSDLEKLRFIEGVAKETLRLHPLAPLGLPKVVQGGPVKLSGFTIPNGTWSYVNFYSLGVDGNYWKNPLEFRPERFLEEDIDVFGKNYNLLPFGAGRRVCPGSKLGFDTFQIGIATLVQGFEWSLTTDADKMSMEATYGLVCHKAEPLVAVAVPRLPTHVYHS